MRLFPHCIASEALRALESLKAGNHVQGAVFNHIPRFKTLVVQWWKEGPTTGNSAWEVSTPPAWSLGRENPTGFLQRAEGFLYPFGLCAHSAEWKITSIDWRTLPSSSLNHRIRKVGVRFLLGFCFLPVLKAGIGCSSLISSVSHASKICMVPLLSKVGTSVLPPERYPVLGCKHSEKQSITSLVLSLPTQPQDNDGGFVFLLNLPGWFRLLALTFCSAFYPWV